MTVRVEETIVSRFAPHAAKTTIAKAAPKRHAPIDVAALLSSIPISESDSNLRWVALHGRDAAMTDSCPHSRSYGCALS